MWMNNETVEKYLKTVYPSNRIAPVKKLLVWDEFRAHTSENTKAVMRELALHSAIVAGGCTKAPHVCWNAPFKARLRQYYDSYVAD